MFHSVRLASMGVRYPLTLHGPARWRRGSAPIQVPLPDVPPDHVIAASFVSNQAAAFSFSLAAGRRKRAETARFGARARRREASAHAHIGVPVDYFHTHAALRRPMLSLRCACPAPQKYLLSIAIRPRVIAPPTDIPADVAAVPASRLSQTTLAAADRPRACSPTAAAMALGITRADDLRAFVGLARHPATGMLGVWPQNLWAAARRGRLGAVELVSDWQTVRQALTAPQPGGAAGTPRAAVVASIRFDRGALPGSPLPATGGHLVAVRGVAAGKVVVHDPAAPAGAVLRHYGAKMFAAAWMRWRGAAYVFASSGFEPGAANAPPT